MADGNRAADFRLTDKQQQASAILASQALHQLFFGGSRSGKTFLIVRAIIIRALRADGSRHAILRQHFAHVRQSIGMDTLPKVMKFCFPGVPFDINKTDWYLKLPNGSEIWLGGLDDKERVEKIFGKEYATLFFNECSQMSYASVETALTRLAQKTDLALRAYYDENPPAKSHWSYKEFFMKLNPATQGKLPDPDNYISMQFRPDDNADNIPRDALTILQNMSGQRRQRFYLGEFAEANPNALFDSDIIDRYRIVDQKLPDFQRVVIGVDPSGSDDQNDTEHDEIGIIVGALGSDGDAYILEDLTINAGPAKWGAVVGVAFDRHEADCVIGEVNYGGAMVKHVIQTARPGTPFREAKASRGKVVRAEPISALYEQGRIHHVGNFWQLENELAGFSTTGYIGDRSPNRADALVWMLSGLFPALTKPEDGVMPKIETIVPPAFRGPHGFLAS